MDKKTRAENRSIAILIDHAWVLAAGLHMCDYIIVRCLDDDDFYSQYVNCMFLCVECYLVQYSFGFQELRKKGNKRKLLIFKG